MALHHFNIEHSSGVGIHYFIRALQMKLRIYSDIHNEVRRYFKFPDFEILPLQEDKDSILVLAGDIDTMKRAKAYAEAHANRFKAVVAILGNHEHYRGNLTKNVMNWNSELPNVHLLENSSVQIEDVVFLGCTLYTDFNKYSPLDMFDASRHMRDYRQTRYGVNYNKLTPEVLGNIHKESKLFLEHKLETTPEDCKIVVVTHHAPSYLSAKGTNIDSLSSSFYSSLESFVERANLWIHGHTHHNVDYKLGDCRVYTNQVGYARLEQVVSTDGVIIL